MNTERDETRRKPVRLIAAACCNMGIGKNGHLPWTLPTEFQYFLNTITSVCQPGKKNLIVWGKTSWLSCPENVFPLANSLNVVLSKRLRSVPKHAHYLCEDFDGAIRLVSLPSLSSLVETIWILGGAQVYKALEHPWCDYIYLTDIMEEFDCDVFFPKFDRNIFKKQDRFPGVSHDIQEENGIKFQFQVFKKES
ncbi:dihydrofolate reductase isoform X2 [Electrophorus electricus]|uniref:dihydrofolate reductase isoform X2 n=1 Tax=Electrophorus electricus TaxID=8005 RepID=UPI0015D0B50E|nr:dihydrofolate reductase isoform X2 [Electrophorus electricus]